MFTTSFDKLMGMTPEEFKEKQIEYFKEKAEQERRNKLWESKEAEREQLENAGDTGYNFIRYMNCNFIEKSKRDIEFFRNILFKVLANAVGESEKEVRRVLNFDWVSRDIDEDGDECLTIKGYSKINHKPFDHTFKYKDELFDKYYQELKPQRRKKDDTK